MIQPGEMREVLDLQKMGEGQDEYGNPVPGGYETQFSVPARIRTLKAGETVIASRLAGTATLVATIRWQPAVADMATDWRAVNGRDGTTYNIRAITVDERRAWVDLLMESGVN
jgi:SPP1 family predicted phage head-tail adaptor